MNPRRTLIAMLATIALISSCSSSGEKKSPTAPPPPDNPTPPALNFSADWQASPATIQLTPPNEDLVADFIRVAVHTAGSGASPLWTDLGGGTVLHQAQATAVHVTGYQGGTGPYVWDASHRYHVDITVHRPNQTTKFNLVLLNEP